MPPNKPGSPGGQGEPSELSMPAVAARRPSAVALSYRAGMHAPTVVARGYGLMAEQIVNKARGAGVFVHDSPGLVNLLMQVDLDEHIPQALYLTVAEILAFVHFLEQQAALPAKPAPAPLR